MDLFGRKRRQREAAEKAVAEFIASQYGRLPTQEDDWAEKFISKAAQRCTICLGHPLGVTGD